MSSAIALACACLPPVLEMTPTVVTNQLLQAGCSILVRARAMIMPCHLKLYCVEITVCIKMRNESHSILKEPCRASDCVPECNITHNRCCAGRPASIAEDQEEPPSYLVSRWERDSLGTASTSSGRTSFALERGSLDHGNWTGKLSGSWPLLLVSLDSTILGRACQS